MKRKIGEEFGFLGYVLRAEKPFDGCNGCFFFEHNLACYHKEILSVTGDCGIGFCGSDRIFTKVM